MDTPVNRLSCAVAAAPGATGAFSPSTAQTLARGFGAAQDGQSFTILALDTSIPAWEVRNGCVFSNAANSLSRGTLEDSSTGGVVALTAATIISVTPSAGNQAAMQTAVTSATSAATAAATSASTAATSASTAATSASTAATSATAAAASAAAAAASAASGGGGGGGSSSSGFALAAMTGTKNGSNTSFAIPDGTVTTCLVVWNGQLLSTTGGGFTRSGATITLATAPGASDDLYALVYTTTTSGLSMVAVTGTRNGSNTTFTIPNGSVTTCLVAINGQLLSVAGGGFTRSSATITMTVAPEVTADLYALVA